MRRFLTLRDGLALSCAFASLLLVAALGVAPGARGDDDAPKAETKKDEAAKGDASESAPKKAVLPAADQFIKTPETPLELWDAADFLVRTGQVKQAVPYIEAFLKSKPDDETLVRIRDRYGVRSVLQLDKYPETRRLAPQVVGLLNAAARRHATRPERINRFINALTKSREEQQYAVERLRESGPYAVPFLVRALESPRYTPEERSKIVHNMGRLDTTAVPALIALLDSGKSQLVADAADALGQLGDPRAVPQLTFLGAAANRESLARDQARGAIGTITGRPFDTQVLSPLRVLTAEARKYHLHQVRFPSGPVEVWEWSEADGIPVPRQVSPSEAEAIFGIKFAREALVLDPADRRAQVALLSLALEKAVERGGYAAFPASDPSNSYASALAAGPAILSEVVRGALEDGKMDLAAVAVTALGQVTDANALPTDPRPNPLVQALSAPSRRVQFAAARALVLLNPAKAFPGSSWVVPTLARFVPNQAPPRAVIIDGNAARGGQLAGYLKALGYEPELAETGNLGFRAAAERADVELILIDVHLIQGSWRVVDTVSNLRNDARTAGVPIFLVGPLSVDSYLGGLKENYPGLRFVVQPTSPAILEQQLGGRPSSLSADERVKYGRDAAALLAQLAQEPGSPFEADLVRAERDLTIGLNTPPTAPAAAAALGDVPHAGAQRGLADTVLDPGKPASLRLNSAYQLARNLQRFGPLVAGDQEVKLLSAFDAERDPALRAGLAAVLGALKPQPALAGARLQLYQRVPAAVVPPASEPVSSPPASGATPPPPPAETPTPGAEAKP